MNKNFIAFVIVFLFGIESNSLFAQNNLTAHVLAWDSGNFRQWYKEHGNTKVMFQFLVRSKLNLTLAGWAFTPDDDYSDYDASIKLIMINTKEDLEIDDSVFLGNLKLKSALIQRIFKKQYPDSNDNNATHKFIIFKPEIDENNHLTYILYLSDKDNEFDKTTALRVAATDPSPPATSK